MVVNLQNLRIQAQEPTEQIDIQEEKIESTGSTWIDSLQQTGIDLQNQASSFDVEESQELPTFNIKPTAWVDEQKVQSFIQRGVELWKSKEEIENAYQKGLDQWTFSKQEERQFDDGGAFKKVFTESFPQAWRDIKEGIFRFGADVSKLKRWVFKEEILWKEDEVWGIKKGILWRIGSSAIERERQLAQRKSEQWDIWQTGVEKGIEALGQGAWLISDIFWEAFITTLWTLATDEEEALTKKAIQDWLNSELWKEWVAIFKDQKAWFEEFERQNPRIWSLIRSAGNFGILWLDVAWIWATKAWIKTTEKALDDFSKTLVGSTKTWLEKWKELWIKWKDVLWEVSEKWVEWLWDIAEKKAKTLETKATELVRNEAEEIALPTLDELTKKWRGEVFKDVTEWWDIIRSPKEWVAIEEVTRLIDDGKISKKMTEVKKRQVIESEIEDISKGLVNDLKNSDAKISKDEMVTLFDDLWKQILDKPTITWSAEATIKKLLPILREKLIKNDYFPEDILQLRKDFDKAIREAKWELAFDPKLENAFTTAVRDFRQGLNNKVWELVPDANVKSKLDRQSGLFEVTKTLQDRFSGQWGSFVKRSLQAIEDFTWIPKTEIVELSTALWLIWLWTWIAVPLWIWVWATALWLKWLKSLWKATNKRKVAKLLKRFDEAVSKNPSKASQLKEAKSEIKKIFDDKKLKEKSVEQRLDAIQRILDIIEPSQQKKLSVWTKQPVITQQTAEKGVIQESKKGLGDLKTPWTKADLWEAKRFDDSINQTTSPDKLKNLREEISNSDIDINIKSKLLKEIDEQIDILDTAWDTKKIESETLTREYWDDLLKSFNKLAWDEKRVIKTKSGDKFTEVEFLKTDNANNFSQLAQEYLKQNPWIDDSVQEIFEKLKDLTK